MTQRVNNPDPEKEKIRKMLSSCGQYPAVKQVAERIFQRIPSVMRDWGVELEKVSTTKRKTELIKKVLEKIDSFICDPELAKENQMPSKVEQYLSYVALVVGISRAASKQWTVYLLKDYPGVEDNNYQMEELGYDLRKKLKSALSELGLRAAVQTETAHDRIWFRVAFVKKSKDRKKDCEKLCGSRSTMLAYFPGEPYFYAPNNLKAEIGDGLVTCLGCTSYTQLPLAGKHIDSLRRLRLGRDGRQGSSIQQQTTDRFGLFPSEDLASTSTPHPVLDRIAVAYDSSFRGCEELPDPALMEGKMLNAKLEITGKDVIGGLKALVELGVVSDPPPKWISNVATAGRSNFKLLDGGRAVPRRDCDNESVISGRREWDNESVMSGVSLLGDRTMQRQF